MDSAEQEAFGLPAVQAIDHDPGDVASNKSEPLEAAEDEDEAAAVKIQAVYRGHATRASGSCSGPEKRIDPADGNAYAMQDFVDTYGGTAEWDAAAPDARRGSGDNVQEIDEPNDQSPEMLGEEPSGDESKTDTVSPVPNTNLPEPLPLEPELQLQPTAEAEPEVESAPAPAPVPELDAEPEPDATPQLQPRSEPWHGSEMETAQGADFLHEGLPNSITAADQAKSTESGQVSTLAQNISPLEIPSNKTVEGGAPDIYQLANSGDATKLFAALAVLEQEDPKRLADNLAQPDTAAGWLPSHYAAVHTNVEMLKTLLGYGAPVDGKTTEGQTCMHFAVMWGYERHISALLEHGANVNTPNDFGATPLHWCAERGSAEVMQLLLDARPDLDAIDETGRTPLHFAAEAEQLREAMLLIAAGARVDVKDVYGKLALELASAEVRGVLDRQATTGTDDITAAPDIDVSFFEWVARHGLQQYSATFIKHAVELESLHHLDESHLSEMGIPIGARMKILHAIDDYRARSQQSPTPSRGPSQNRRQGPAHPPVTTTVAS